MVFIGMRCVKAGIAWKAAKIVHFNPHYIKTVDEREMMVTLDDGSQYRIDDESLQIFLAAMYGEDRIRGDKLKEEEDL